MINNFEDFLKENKDFDQKNLNLKKIREGYSNDQLKIMIGYYKKKIKKLEKENKELKEKLNGKQLKLGI